MTTPTDLATEEAADSPSVDDPVAVSHGDSFVVGVDSRQSPTLSVVLPTLDEEQGIADCIAKVKAAVSTLEVPTEVIVSDSSTDRTPEIADSMGAIVVEPDEPGYGYAYQYAFERARGDYIAIGDADTTYDFEELPKLFEHVASGDADMAMGSRLEGDIRPDAMPPLHQYVGNPLLTKFLNLFYGVGVSDAHSGMRVLSRDALEQMEFQTTGMEFASEMIMEAGAQGLTIEEEPITYHERKGEATLDSFRDGWRHVRFMLINAPGYLFSVPGFALGALGALVMVAATFGVSVGSVSLGVHSMIAGSLFTLVGAQGLALGVFSTLTADPIREPNDPFTQWLLERVRLEHGATAGVLVAAAGVAYGAIMTARWVESGFTTLPLLLTDVLALTAIVFGLQLLFNSFFFSAIADNAP